MTPRLLVIALLATLPVAVGAGADPAQHSEREVLPGGPGGNRLEVDVPLLLGSPAGLDSLRLETAQGGEVPYLLVGPSRAEPVWRGGSLLDVASTEETSGFEVDLGAKVTVDRLALVGLPAPFLKRLRLEGGGDRSRWTELVAEGTLFDLPDEGLRHLELAFDPGEYRYLRLQWDDRTSGRVPRPRSVAARLVQTTPPPRPLTLEVPFERLGSEPGTTRYRVRLPIAGLPIVALELDAAPCHVLREARVSEARLEDNEIRPRTLGTATLRRTVRGDVVAGDLRLAVSRPLEVELELEVDDGSSPPLPLEAIRAELAPQPWVYFESESGGPLTARYGAVDVGAPRYDLEALRSELEGGRSDRVRASARWGPAPPRRPAPPAPPPELMVSAGAPVDGAAFSFTRPVPSGPPGVVALRLDAHVLASTRELADLRLVGDDGRQVPYLVERLAAPLVVPLEPLQVAPDALPGDLRRVGESLYRLRLPYPTLPAGRVSVATTVRVFERPVRLLRVLPGQGRRAEPLVETLSTTVWRNSRSEAEPPPLTVALPPHAGSELVLALDEGDNSPLPLEAPTLYLPASRLRFVRNGEGPVALVYGRSGLAPPRYDLALLAPRVLGAPAEEVEPGAVDERARREVGPGAQRVLFWGALVLAVVFLLGIMVRLVRTSGGDQAG